MKICGCEDAEKGYVIINPDSPDRREILSLNPPICRETIGNALDIDGQILPFEKEIVDWDLLPLASENIAANYKITLSNWYMGGSEYGGFSTSFNYSKRLRLVDLLYEGSSFFSGKTLLQVNAPNYPSSSLGYLAAKFQELAGNFYYVIFSQTSTPQHFFRIDTLLIHDLTNTFTYYNDKYQDGSVASNPANFYYSGSNWLTNGIDYGSVVNGEFSTPTPSTVIGLITFVGAYSGNASIVHNAMSGNGYPVSSYGYLGILLQSKTNGNLYLAIISQYVNNFSITTFTLTGSGGFIHHQSSWINGSHGAILNPSDFAPSSYEGGKQNPYLGSGCGLQVNYVDNTQSSLIEFPQCPQNIKKIETLEISDMGGILEQIAPAPSGEIMISCGERECPPETCFNCDCSELNCCYDENGKLIDSFTRRT